MIQRSKIDFKLNSYRLFGRNPCALALWPHFPHVQRCGDWLADSVLGPPSTGKLRFHFTFSWLSDFPSADLLASRPQISGAVKGMLTFTYLFHSSCSKNILGQFLLFVLNREAILNITRDFQKPRNNTIFFIPNMGLYKLRCWFRETDLFLPVHSGTFNDKHNKLYWRDYAYKLKYIQGNPIKGDPIFGGMEPLTGKIVANG